MTLTYSTAVKVLTSVIAASVVLGLLLFYFVTPPSPPAHLDARLEEFLDGFAFKEQMRLKVRDVHVGDESVKQLFRPFEAETPTWWEVLVGRKNPKPLTISDPNDIKELRRALDARQPNEMVVFLEDDADHWLIRWWLKEKYDDWKQTRVYINVKQTPCAEVRRIVYDKISAAVRERTQTKEADKEIDLDEVFNLLLEDKIDQYLYTLDEAKEGGECFRTIQLLKWIKGEEIQGFGSGHYEFVEPIRLALDPALDALAQTRSNKARYNLKVKVVGYTDAEPVTEDPARRPALQKGKTGIRDWSVPLNVFYLGCDENMLEGDEPAYIPLDSGGGTRVKQTITDNCELGAARAYVAAVYMLNRLGRDGTEYSYATGGVSPGAGKEGSTNEPKERKINIKFIINAATVDR